MIYLLATDAIGVDVIRLQRERCAYSTYEPWKWQNFVHKCATNKRSQFFPYFIMASCLVNDQHDTGALHIAYLITCTLHRCSWVTRSRRPPSAVATVLVQSAVNTVVSAPSWSCHNRLSGWPIDSTLTMCRSDQQRQSTLTYSRTHSLVGCDDLHYLKLMTVIMQVEWLNEVLTLSPLKALIPLRLYTVPTGLTDHC